MWVCAPFCGASSALAEQEPILVGPYLHALGSFSVEIRAETRARLPVEVTVTRAGDTASPLRFSSKEGLHHTIVMSGLEPRTRYTYTVFAGTERVEGEFVTAPREDALEPFTVLAYGDNRTDDEAHAAVVQAMLRTPSDLLAHTGDFIGDARRQDEWLRFFDIEKTLLRDRCLFSAIGNHDLTDDGVSYKRYFGALNGSMRWQFARFWFVNAMDDSPRTWLPKDLAAHDGEPGVIWRVVVLHQGPYASGPHGGADLPASTLGEWRAHKVDLVISGHDHIYERGLGEGGLRYIVTGGGGAPAYPIEHRLPTTRTAEATRHFVELKFAPSDVKVAAHRIDGTTIETCSFTKNQGWNDDPVVDVAPPKVTPVFRERTSFWNAKLLIPAILLLLLVGGRLYRKRQDEGARARSGSRDGGVHVSRRARPRANGVRNEQVRTGSRDSSRAGK